MDVNPIEYMKSVQKVRDRELDKLDVRKVDEKKDSQKIEKTTSTDTKSRPVTESQLLKVVKEANQKLTLANSNYKLFYNSEKGRYVVKIIDRETNKEVGEIPSENLEKLMDYIWDVTGLIIDEKI